GLYEEPVGASCRGWPGAASAGSGAACGEQDVGLGSWPGLVAVWEGHGGGPVQVVAVSGHDELVELVDVAGDGAGGVDGQDMPVGGGTGHDASKVAAGGVVMVCVSSSGPCPLPRCGGSGGCS